MVSVSPATALMELLLPEPSSVVPKAVGSRAVNVSEPGASSARTTVSTSPVRGLMTVTVTLPSPARSGSVTVSVASSPTFATVIATMAVVPPLIVSVAATVGEPPLAASASR